MRVIKHHRSKSAVSRGTTLADASVLFRNFAEECGFLRKMADEFASNQTIRELALKIIFPRCLPRDERCQSIAIGEWVQSHISYVHEHGEVFQRPTLTLQQKAGDCDSTTTLICALLGSVGIKNAMCLLQIGGRWAHIFPVALVKTDDGLHRLTLDTTLTDPIADLVNPIAKVKASGRTVTRVKFA